MKRLIFVCVILMIGILPGVVLAGWDANLKIFIPTQGQVVFYDNPGCRGEPYMVLKVGEYKDFGTIGFMGSGNWHDKTSCIDVGPGTSMTVYEKNHLVVVGYNRL